MTAEHQRYRPSEGDRAYDTKSGCNVKVKTDPGIYAQDRVWVQPVRGGPGWPAKCADLEPVTLKEASAE
ncbi:hypothetical protein [Streptomyces halobius]|uniref:Uncharacterized protein n=1 Tax=Streptomyces halobius TaxID=2879846 RepID=A0ABY4M0Z0_9ACTN|nr:hypothetical protein [Streptomyces halobius]UQA91430.1 hypothetical protein K9S39_05645 [Streptomyces halobius]